MGQRITILEEEENELFNLFQLNQKQRTQQIPQVRRGPLVRMMASTSIGVKPRVVEPIPAVHRASDRQVQQFGQRH
jgi:hypothetical protein